MQAVMEVNDETKNSKIVTVGFLCCIHDLPSKIKSNSRTSNIFSNIATLKKKIQEYGNIIELSHKPSYLFFDIK